MFAAFSMSPENVHFLNDPVTFHVSSLDFFELPVDKMNDVMLGLVRLFDSLIL